MESCAYHLTVVKTKAGSDFICGHVSAKRRLAQIPSS